MLIILAYQFQNKTTHFNNISLFQRVVTSMCVMYGNFCNSVVKCLILLQSDLRGVLEICKNQFTVRNMKWVIYFSKVHIAENVSESSSHLLAGSLCTVRCSAYNVRYAARHLVAHRCSALEIFGIFCHCYIAQIR